MALQKPHHHTQEIPITGEANSGVVINTSSAQVERVLLISNC
jgi:ACT domain-containing protein